MQQYLNSTRRTLSVFKSAHDAHRLDLSPAFQRKPVWTAAQKSYLIDSILRGYPIPELYVQESVDSNGVERFVVVDGQQRLRACLEFLEGSLALTPKEAPDWPDYRFDDLNPEDKSKVFGYNFIVRQLPESSDEELRKIFSRLNRNVVALNQQELRHSTYWGGFISTMEKLSEREYWSTSGLFSANDIRRMLDVEFISELVIAYLHGFQNKKAHLDKWYATYEPEFPDEMRVEACFSTVLGELSVMLPQLPKTRWRKKSDFYSLFLYLAEHESFLPLSRQSRITVQKKLLDFGVKIDKIIGGEKVADKFARKYVTAVERAASDLASRVARHKALDGILSSQFKSGLVKKKTNAR